MKKHMCMVHDYTQRHFRAVSFAFDVARAADLGVRALQMVTDQNWQGIKDDEAVTQWLCTHCIVCNVYVASLKRVNTHMRQNHSAHIEGLLQLAGVVLKRCGTLSPCEFCYKTFQHEHLCPAAIQAAMILLRKLPTAAADSDPGGSAERAGNFAQRRARRLVVNDFVLARDSTQGRPRCNHCHREFTTLNGLRLHIALDKCPQFDITRSQTPVAPDAHMLSHPRSGTLKAWLGEDAHRRMTCHCQTCGIRFTGAYHLANHMQMAHSELWDAAATCTFFLSAYVQTIRRCVCNPSPGTVRPEHQCMILRQIAMQYVRARNAGDYPGLFLPYAVTVEELSALMPHAPADLCVLLHDTGCLLDFLFHATAQHSLPDLWS
eukprot:s326_g32.t1